MTNDLPSWVSEYDDEYNENNKRSKFFLIVGLSLIVISFLFLFITELREDLTKFQLIAFIIAGIGTILFTLSFNKSSNYYKHLASMFYFIGYNLEENSDTQSNIYINKMDKHLKNCDEIINKVDISLRSAIYVKNTSDYLKKLNELVELLNEFYINHPKYDVDKADIAHRIIQLADLIHNDNGYITDEHINLIDLLIIELTEHDVVEKTLYISNTEKIISTYKTISSGIPYNFKLVTYVAFIIFVAYNLINYVALSKGITQETAFGVAVTGSIAALVPALMVRDQIIK